MAPIIRSPGASLGTRSNVAPLALAYRTPDQIAALNVLRQYTTQRNGSDQSISPSAAPAVAPSAQNAQTGVQRAMDNVAAMSQQVASGQAQVAPTTQYRRLSVTPRVDTSSLAGIEAASNPPSQTQVQPSGVPAGSPSNYAPPAPAPAQTTQVQPSGAPAGSPSNYAPPAPAPAQTTQVQPSGVPAGSPSNYAPPAPAPSQTQVQPSGVPAGSPSNYVPAPDTPMHSTVINRSPTAMVAPEGNNNYVGGSPSNYVPAAPPAQPALTLPSTGFPEPVNRPFTQTGGFSPTTVQASGAPGGSPNNYTASTPAAATNNQFSYGYIQPGQTVEDYARQTGQTLDDVLAINPQLSVDSLSNTTRQVLRRDRNTNSVWQQLQPGESLSMLAAANGTTVAEMIRLNPQVQNPNYVQAGEFVRVPTSSGIDASGDRLRALAEQGYQMNAAGGIDAPQQQPDGLALNEEVSPNGVVRPTNPSAPPGAREEYRGFHLATIMATAGQVGSQSNYAAPNGAYGITPQMWDGWIQTLAPELSAYVGMSPGSAPPAVQDAVANAAMRSQLDRFGDNPTLAYIAMTQGEGAVQGYLDNADPNARAVGSSFSQALIRNSQVLNPTSNLDANRFTTSYANQAQGQVNQINTDAVQRPPTPRIRNQLVFDEFGNVVARPSSTTREGGEPIAHQGIELNPVNNVAVMGFDQQPTGETYSGPITVSDFAAGIREQETHNDYSAVNSSSGASGAYQFINSTWNEYIDRFAPEYAEYKGRAVDAPPEVQDAVAEAAFEGLAKQYDNDPELMAIAWFGGEGRANDYRNNGQDLVPPGNVKSIKTYASDVVGRAARFAQERTQPTPTPSPSPTPTPSPTATPTGTPSATPTPTPTSTPSRGRPGASPGLDIPDEWGGSPSTLTPTPEYTEPQPITIPGSARERDRLASKGTRAAILQIDSEWERSRAQEAAGLLLNPPKDPLTKWGTDPQGTPFYMSNRVVDGWLNPTSGGLFGPREFHPVSGEANVMHYGTDMGTFSSAGADNARGLDGEPIYAAAPGTVRQVTTQYDRAGNISGAGHYVTVEHTDGTITKYFHLEELPTDIAVGDRVDGGQQIGKMGTSGGSTGTHLHFEVQAPSGEKVDPMPYQVDLRLRQAGIDPKSDATEVQSLLDEAGYDPGGIDGVWSPETILAMERFLYDTYGVIDRG